jgi:hypothetical protein
MIALYAQHYCIFYALPPSPYHSKSSAAGITVQFHRNAHKGISKRSIAKLGFLAQTAKNLH